MESIRKQIRSDLADGTSKLTINPSGGTYSKDLEVTKKYEEKEAEWEGEVAKKEEEC